jgi:SEC-C motif-containing protein
MRRTCAIAGIQKHVLTTLTLDKKTKWTGLKITPRIAKKIKDTNDAHENTVEFIAHYKINGKTFHLHEISLFTQYQGRWVYLRQA